ncbi:MAG: metalloprotease PmbA [Methylophilaceae bacterium]
MTNNDLSNIAAFALEKAKSNGASDAEVEISVATGKSITVRLSELETIEMNNDKSFSLSVYFGKKRGLVTSSDFSLQAIENCVLSACQIAKYTQEDEGYGLADKSLLAKDIADLEVYFPFDLTESFMIDHALATEAEALGFNTFIKNSEGVQFSNSEANFIYANSNGFAGGFPSSRITLSCSVIANDDGQMQRDSLYTTARNFSDLRNNIDLGKETARRAASKLNPKKIKTGRYPVIFEAPIATSLISTLVSALSGGNLYRQNSFFLDALGKSIASSHLTITENPFLKRGNASTYFDDDGVRVSERKVVDQGQLNGYFLSTYTASKLNLTSTGNAGGAHNLIIETSNVSFDDMLKNMGTGLLVTDILGHGTNMVTGDYSRGASGFWVENGEIAFPVEEITVAGNLKNIYKDIRLIANDVYLNSSKYTGSILINEMTVGSNN